LIHRHKRPEETSVFVDMYAMMYGGNSPFCLVYRYKSLGGGDFCLLPQGVKRYVVGAVTEEVSNNLTKEPETYPEILLPILQATRNHFPEGRNI